MLGDLFSKRISTISLRDYKAKDGRWVFDGYINPKILGVRYSENSIKIDILHIVEDHYSGEVFSNSILLANHELEFFVLDERNIKLSWLQDKEYLGYVEIDVTSFWEDGSRFIFYKKTIIPFKED
jgi:hypothetical protein